MKNETLKDLFLKKKNYIVEIPIDKENYLYIEGLNNFGEAILNNKPFSIKKIKNFCVEIINNGDPLEVNTPEIKRLTKTIKTLQQETKNIIKGSN